jgi:hypothetical protein
LANIFFSKNCFEIEYKRRLRIIKVATKASWMIGIKLSIITSVPYF